MSSFLFEYKWIILFYIGILLLIYFKRQKFEIQAKFIALYRTKVGIKFMERIASKYGGFLKILGYSAIGIGFIGSQALNVTVDGYVELQKRRSGDILDIYLKPDNSTWYWISYTRGVLMALSGNNNFNTILREEKLKDRKHPDNTVRLPYTYMVGVQDRLDNFLRRMERPPDDEFIEDDIDFNR